MIKSNVRSYELVKAINDEQITLVDASGTSTIAGVRTGVSTSAVYNDILTNANTEGKSTQAFIRKEDILAAATKYTTTKVWVYLDQEGAIKFYQEFVSTAQEFVELALEKYFDETISDQEFEFIDFLKTLEEEILVVDLFSALSDKLVLDTTELSDSYILDLEKVNQENVDALEQVGLGIDKPLSDIEELVDNTEISFTTQFDDATEQSDSVDLLNIKSTTDTQPQSDAFSRTVDYNREYSDNVLATEQIAGFSFTDEESDSVAVDPIGVDDDPAFDLVKAPILESYTTDDSSLIAVNKPIQDAIVPIELYSSELQKQIEDSSTAIDFQYSAFNKFTDENINQYDEIEVLIEWIREFEEFVASNDIYASLFEMGQIDDSISSVDEFDRTVEYNRDFSDNQTIIDQISSVSFDDLESDSVVTDPIGMDDDPAFNLDKSPIDLTVSNVDLAILEFSKALSELQNQLDLIQQYELNKPLTDSQVIEEQPSIDFATSNADSYSVADDYLTVIDFNRDFQETVDNTDTNTFSIDKSLTDSQANLDDYAIDFTKPDLSDTYSIDDQFTRTVDYNRSTSDSVSTVDTLSGIAFSDEETDSVAFDPFHVDDDPAFDLNKPTNDSFTATEQYVIDNALSKSDTQNQTDYLNEINTNKSISESQSQTETNSLSFDKGSIPEVSTVTDYFDRTTSYTRSYTETQAQTDDKSVTFVKGTVQETITEVDSKIIQTYKYLYETMSESDSGSLLNTDYVGSYYFNDDFVGSKRTF